MGDRRIERVREGMLERETVRCVCLFGGGGGGEWGKGAEKANEGEREARMGVFVFGLRGWGLLKRVRKYHQKFTSWEE